MERVNTKGRYSFAKSPDVLELPNLIEVQVSSYDHFLQLTKEREEKARQGLQEIFMDVFPIESYDRLSSLEFVSYSLSMPKFSSHEAMRRGITYAASLRAKLRLILKEEPEATLGSIKEEDVYLCEMPLMTEKGTFIINGAERVIVSQLHRSPGVCFEEKIHPSGKHLLCARVIPYRGAWLEFEFDINDLIYMYMDRHSRLIGTAILKAMGYETREDILALFYQEEKVQLTEKGPMFGGKPLSYENLFHLYLFRDVLHPATGKVLARACDQVTSLLLKTLEDENLKEIELSLIKFNYPNESLCLLRTIQRDLLQGQEEALIEIYRRLRPGDPPTIKAAKTIFERTFFDPNRFNFTQVGRYKVNRALNLDISEEEVGLQKWDIVETLKRLLALRNGEGSVDDIDHLGNRRVRSVGELLANQMRIGFARMERTIKERMNFQELEAATPRTLINPKPLGAAVKDFFGRSQLSHFMDQTNPLAELTHKRRLSAIGPGGLSRERAGFEIRDVHPSHYGRICPIETPEGPNIGLMASLSTYARIDPYGFITAPYRKVEAGRLTDELVYLSAYEEDQYIVGQANVNVDQKGRIKDKLLMARCRGDFPLVTPEEINFVDVTPKQLVSVATALIPFLEHDDANRALMGSNMQRQAVPLLVTEAPCVGTGMEGPVAENSGAMVLARKGGVVESLTSERIIVRRKDAPSLTDVYELQKFTRSNRGTCVNQKPIVKEGQEVKEGDVLADGSATSQGELALGRNILVAFMPWEGYNFEDAILLSEKVLKDDTYTSIHIEEFEVQARETKLGKEEITRDIPNVGEEALKNLDEDGIVHIGAYVAHGDILVGKVSPKGETELTPEEKLIRAIFGDKGKDVRDTSLKVSSGIEGTVIDVKVFSRKDPSQKEKIEAEQKREIERIVKRFEFEHNRLKAQFLQEIKKLVAGHKVAKDYIDSKTDQLLWKKGSTLKEADLEKVPFTAFYALDMKDAKIQKSFQQLLDRYKEQEKGLQKQREQEIDTLCREDELPAGVIKMVKVYVASKRKISVGDKVAGRHGNKGVVAKILPEEDMPFLPDGTPVEIILNPLGVPSRMNLGQILETHLGWAAHELGVKFACPVFDGAKEGELKEYMRKANLPEDGKLTLYDGRTGEPFQQTVSVGYIYMMKLAHLVDDKMHARSIGPYSLVTQQPLGGKAQFGGQRFGEMEVWALEAYGAANILQELLTIKSDDVTGRAKAYEVIVKGGNELTFGSPESFNVLLRELQSLCFNVEKMKWVSEEKEGRPKLLPRLFPMEEEEAAVLEEAGKVQEG